MLKRLWHEPFGSSLFDSCSIYFNTKEGGTPEVWRKARCLTWNGMRTLAFPYEVQTETQAHTISNRSLFRRTLLDPAEKLIRCQLLALSPVLSTRRNIPSDSASLSEFLREGETFPQFWEIKQFVARSNQPRKLWHFWSHTQSRLEVKSSYVSIRVQKMFPKTKWRYICPV